MKLKRKYYSPLLSKPTLRNSIAVLLFMFSFSLRAQIVTIGVQNPAASETGPTNGVFRVASNTPAGFLGLIISYTVSGSATPVDDYTQLSGTATIPFNATEAFIVLESLEDSLVEGDEDVTVSIQPGGYFIGLPSEATITIADNDIPGFTVSESGGGTTTAETGTTDTFSVVLDAQPLTDVVLNVTPLDISEGSVDTANLTFTNGNWNNPQTVTVSGVDDAVVDGDQMYNVRVGVVDGSSDDNFDPLPNQFVSVTNADDDSFTATIMATDNTGTEAGNNNGVFTIDLGSVNGTGSAITVNYTIGGSATNTADYAAITTSVSIPNNQRTGTVTIDPVNDLIAEGTETVILTLANGTGYNIGLPNSAMVNITDNDALVARITATDNTGTEAGNNNGVFTVDLGSVNGMGSPIVVNFTRSGTATHVADYANIGTSVSIANGQRTNTIIINPVNDVVVEGPETVILTLASGTGYTVGAPNNDTVDIVDNDSAGYTLSTTTLSTSENGTNEIFTVVLTAAPESNVVISATSEDTSEGTVSPSTLTFTPSNYNVAQTVSVSPIDDLVVDGPQTYDINLSVVDAGSDDNFDPLADQTVAVTNDDDDTANLSISDAAANEDVASGNLIFDVVLDTEIPGGTTVAYSFSNGTATGGGVDFISTGGSITFTGTAGETQQIEVPIIDDTLLEDTEDFTVQLGTPSNGVTIVGGNTATGTINDDDNCAPAPILNPDISTFFCDVIDRGLNDYTDSTPPSGTVLTWSRVSDPLNTNAHLPPEDVANPPNGGSYFGFFYNAVNSCSSGTIEVELTLNDTPIIDTTMGDERCGPGEVTLTAVSPPDVDEPPTFNWYDSPTGGTLLDTGSSVTFNIAVTTSYYVEAIANGCTSERLEVIATIYPLPSAGTPTNALACNVSANGPTIVDLDDLLTGESSGAWSVTTDPSNSISIGIGNIVNFEDRPDGDYVFTYTTTDATPPFCENVSSEVTVSVNDCDQDTDMDGLFDGVEGTLGTDPNNVDSDGDGIEDGVEVGDDIGNPLDGDGDGIIDALDSNILDSDMDGVVDQMDPANTNPCIPDVNNEFCVAIVDLEITKTASENLIRPNGNISFSITVTNLTDESATSIEVSDLIEEANGFRYVSHFISPQGSGTYDDGTGIWNIPVLESGGEVILTILVEAVAEGVFTNTATITNSVPGDFNPDNNQATSEEIEVSQRTNSECGFLFNQFSPNGDGTNDFLVINCITEPEYANNTLEIYDRYGNQVYATKGYDNRWDGTKDGKDLPKGTYFYILSITSEQSGETDTRKGWIQIIR